MNMFNLVRNKKITRISIIGVCAFFMASYVLLFNFETQAFAQNFGTPGAVNSSFTGLNSLTSNNSNYNANGNYTSTSSAYFNQPQFGQQTSNVTQLQNQNGTGVMGFFRGLFSGVGTANSSYANNNAFTTGSYNNYNSSNNYQNFAGYTNNNYAYNNTYSNTIGTATNGLIGSVGNVLGFGARMVIGAAKVALTLPVLAVKATVYLAVKVIAGTVNLLGRGIGAVKSILTGSSAGVNTLNYQVGNLYNQTTVLGTANTNYNTTNTAAGFNNQQFGTNLNNTYNYANNLQQNLTYNQGLVNTINTGATQAMSNFSINTKLLGLNVIELTTKLAYGTAKLLSGAASQTSQALAQTIAGIEYTKANLRAIKQLNKQGVVNPYLYQQYLGQSQQTLNNSSALLYKANQTVDNSYFGTLSNINTNRGYLIQNGAATTNQMNLLGTSGNIYSQQVANNAYNQYNNGYTALTNTYGGVYNSNTFGTPQTSNQLTSTPTTSSLSSTLANIGFNQGSAERSVTSSATLGGNENAEVKKAQEKYTAAYDKYIKTLNSGDNAGSSDITSALEEYKSAYGEYQKLAESASK